MKINNTIPLGSTVELKTEPEKQYLVKQITVALDKSIGYTIAYGTTSYFAADAELQLAKGTKRIGFELN